MARPKRTNNYEKEIAKMSIEELKTFVTEAQYAIKEREKAEISEIKEEAAIKLRDSLKIGSKVQGMEVIGILVDKVQVMSEGKKKTIALKKLV